MCVCLDLWGQREVSLGLQSYRKFHSVPSRTAQCHRNGTICMPCLMPILVQCLFWGSIFMSSAKNVLGTSIQPCSLEPLTGFFRDGCCRSGADDQGLHLVCAEMTVEFLNFSKVSGNDLITPVPAFGFPGLKPGDRWCLCVQRWKQAFEAGIAPKIILESTHISTLEFVDLEDLQTHSVPI